MMKQSNRYQLAYSFLPKNFNHLLDVGGSDGVFCSLVLDKTPSFCDLLEPDAYHGLFVSEKNRNRFRFFSERLENNSLKSGQYDVVTMLDVFEHVDDENLVVSEIIRVLKPGGILIISVPNACWYDFLDPANVLRKFSSSFTYHRHYSLQKLKSFFSTLTLKNVAYQGTLLGVLIKYILHYRILGFLPRNFFRWKKQIESWDYAQTWGDQSYHVMAVFQKPNE